MYYPLQGVTRNNAGPVPPLIGCQWWNIHVHLVLNSFYFWRHLYLINLFCNCSKVLAFTSPTSFQISSICLLVPRNKLCNKIYAVVPNYIKLVTALIQSSLTYFLLSVSVLASLISCTNARWEWWSWTCQSLSCQSLSCQSSPAFYQRR